MFATSVEARSPSLGAANPLFGAVPAKRFMQSLLSRAGIEIRRKRVEGWHPANVRKSWNPRTIVDVGTATGTPELYRAFPDAYYVMIEPLEECHPAIARLLSRLRGEAHCLAVGAKEETVEIQVDREFTMSSLHSRAALTSMGTSLEKREIEVTTLDKLMYERDWAEPYGLKIDTEGHEDKVIEGASAFLRRAEFVIAEVSIANRFEGSYRFAEFIGLMDSKGWQLTDILRAPRRGDCTLFVDAVFSRARASRSRVAVPSFAAPALD
jgi:FkbM family methyltransferase